MAIHPPWSPQEHCSHPTLALQQTSDFDRVTVAGISNSKLDSERSVRVWLVSSAVQCPVSPSNHDWHWPDHWYAPDNGHLVTYSRVSARVSWSFATIIWDFFTTAAAPLSPAAGTVQVTTFRKVVIVIVNSVRDCVTPRDVTWHDRGLQQCSWCMPSVQPDYVRSMTATLRGGDSEDSSMSPVLH